MLFFGDLSQKNLVATIYLSDNLINRDCGLTNRDSGRETSMAIKFGQIDSKELFTIPNIITYFRILCVPVFVTLMALGGVRDSFLLFYIALGVFLLAAVSDLFDGWIARKFNMQSGIGMVFDPIADKLMHIAVLACLSFCTGLTPLGKNLVDSGKLSNPWFVHWIFVVLILAKELIQAVIGYIFLKKGANVKANWLGKVSSFTISVGVILAFFHNYVQFADWGILAWGVCLSYAAAGAYFVGCMKQLKRIAKGEEKAVTAESVKEDDIIATQNRKEGLPDGVFEGVEGIDDVSAREIENAAGNDETKENGDNE